MFLSNSVRDQSVQWFLGFSFGVYRITLRDHCSLAELSKIVMCRGVCFFSRFFCFPTYLLEALVKTFLCFKFYKKTTMNTLKRKLLVSGLLFMF